MWHKRLTHWFGLILVIALASAPGGARAGGGEILHTQMDLAGTLPVSSTDYAGLLSSQDNQVADDFTLNCASSCQIDTILVSGSYQGTAVAGQPTQVRVQFYSDPETGIPGDLIREYLISRASVGDIDTGDYLINLPSPPLVLGGGTWWLSIQSVNTQSNYTWTWGERTLATPSVYPSAWRNPGGGSNSGRRCLTWGSRLSYCQYPLGAGHVPDQLFEITGNSNTGTNPTPYIKYLSPYHVTPGSGDFTLTIRGHSFVSGSVVKWNVTPVAVLPGNTNSQLQISVPAAWVATGSLVTITVENPAPGGGSASRTFLVGTPVLLPVIRR